MANQLYPAGAEALLAHDIDLMGDDIVLVALSSGGAYNSGHDTISDLGGAVIARSDPLTGKAITAGTFSATVATPTFVGVETDIVYLVIAQDTGDDATSRLIEHRDQDGGLPVTQDGGNVNFTPDNAGLFRLR